MCDFISIGLPNKLNQFIGRWRRRGYALAEHHNPTLKQALPREYTAWLLTRSGCSCELCRRLPNPIQAADSERAIFLREDAAEIVCDLAAMHSDRSYLYVHFYSGDISTERVPILHQTRRTLASHSSTADPIMRDDLIELTTQKLIDRQK